MDYLPTLAAKWLHSRGNGLVNIPYMEHLGYQPPKHAIRSLRLTASSPLEMDGWKITFLWGKAYLRVDEMFVFTECNPHPTKKTPGAIQSVANS